MGSPMELSLPLSDYLRHGKKFTRGEIPTEAWCDVIISLHRMVKPRLEKLPGFSPLEKALRGKGARNGVSFLELKEEALSYHTQVNKVAHYTFLGSVLWPDQVQKRDRRSWLLLARTGDWVLVATKVKEPEALAIHGSVMPVSAEEGLRSILLAAHPYVPYWVFDAYVKLIRHGHDKAVAEEQAARELLEKVERINERIHDF
jgi:hypothetical protein